jgi:hypothetical protein
MDPFATNLIASLGGTTAVAALIEAPISTVHSWKRIGIPPSRLAHIKLAATAAGLEVDWATDESVVASEAAGVSIDGADAAGDAPASTAKDGETFDAERAAA